MAIDFNKRDATARPEVVVDINTTPLIDVMLVLLVMLIITIPDQDPCGEVGHAGRRGSAFGACGRRW